jgi:ribonuclease HII
MCLATAGMDEVGRGALAGPLVAAAVVLAPNLERSVDAMALVDSKLLSHAEREELDRWIRTHADLVLIELVGVAAINQLGMGWANRIVYARLMARGGAGRYVVDGNLRLHRLAPAGSVVICRCKGEQHNRMVAAASIVAKVYRDRLMQSLHRAYPAYGWDRNAGYATPEHRRAIQQVGICAEHRTLYVRRSRAATSETAVPVERER